MADKLDIFSRTLVKCGQRPLLSLTDQRPEQRAIDRVYDSAVKKLIEGAFWKFASRTDELHPSLIAVSNFGYQYVYETPQDYVRVIRISDNERMRPTLRDFMFEGDYVYADCSPLYLQYVSNDPTYGYDVGKWTPSFSDALVDELVVRTAPFLIAADIQKMEQFEKQAKRSFYTAKGRDAVNQPECWTPPGRLSRARSGGQRINNMRAVGYPYY